MKKNVIEEQSINDVNYELLKKQFPHAVSIDENGKYVIDPQKLQMSLDPSKAEIKEDGYGLNWVGKKEAYHNAFTKNYKVLKPLKNESKNWDKTENILIKGDNLDALKILRQNYFESIKMIYIDPPYNTKNDGFVYNDNFTTSTEQTLEELGYDKEYIDYIENIQGAKTHSGWLSFMYPRLLLAKDLLKDDGVIFISIDDNEAAQLKLLCDEIFCEENFLSQFLWKKKGTTSNVEGAEVSSQVDYQLCYKKSQNAKIKQRKTEKETRQYPYSDEIGSYRTTVIEKKDSGGYKRDTMKFEILGHKPRNGKRWQIGIETAKELEAKNRFIYDGEKIILKIYDFEDKDTYSAQPNLLDFCGSSDSASKLVNQEIFGNTELFDTPKPLELLNYFINITTDENDIILDFFSGSGTTAHAIMDLNAQDNCNRKFICIQWAEKTPEKSEAKKAGYETIFDITKARIDKAGEQLVKGDIGFRTFEIVEDQKQKIYQKSLEDVSQDDLLAMMEKPDISSNEEILYNLFVAEALPLSTKHQELIKDKLYLASNVAFILGDITSDELVEALKDKKECEYITVYSPNISNDKFTLEIESNISKLDIKSDKLRFRG
ncbi:site-specific DNA-methyltransferase [Aliarcobacter thereius]|uniref:site-specific DNA-methyltransferase (adenine-specific) n=1 Tax=Aliarcobacter thereius LMG 24486 TaxID=1032240 RepID=A0A1C7WS52_9BACT|nr:site-specific DNA-methyltransferase [Aliarcobacter thereius]OCL90616.1 putative methyltransferase [Aliarcobacter thereius]OCL95617.1 putative methyltransferase [Aliarcobacter thereius LMG 24486]QBF16396.1 type III restriction/modification system, mod subunit [Aliarcobacter thereius LMG 24486]TLS91452.1 site-specific DNA-methyltransferase [Aliarcobacter thereius]